jgi:hypothetical protein
LKSGWIHFLGAGGIEDINPDTCGKIHILLEITRIGSKILTRAKLDGVDKKGNHHPVTELPGLTHQGQMAAME